MPDKAWFRDWFNSHYYHLLYQHRDDREAMDFIATLIQYLQPKSGSRMLDVACGKGRHSKALADMGFDVTGIDLSAASIIAAKEQETESLHFYQHDMRLPFWVNYYDYAFNFFTSFGYFKTRREHDSAIRTVAQSLQHGGYFVIDYLNAHYIENHLQYKSEFQKDDVLYYITRWLDETHFYKKIVIEDEANLQEPLEFTEKVAKFSLGDFNDMFSFYDLQVQEVYGDYHFEPYHVNNSPRLIILAKKMK